MPRKAIMASFTSDMYCDITQGDPKQDIPPLTPLNHFRLGHLGMNLITKNTFHLLVLVLQSKLMMLDKTTWIVFIFVGRSLVLMHIKMMLNIQYQ